MIYKLDKLKAIEAILKVVEQQNNDTLQEIYRRIEISKVLSQVDVLRIWNKIIQPSSLNDDELDELLKVCLSVCNLNDYSDFLIEVDTSPIKKRYLESINGQKSKVVALQYLELFTEKIESVYHKDICQLTYDEAIAGFANLPNLSANPLRQALTVARGYCKWCQDHREFDGAAQNNFKNIKPEDIPIDPWVQNNIVKDPIDLVSRIESTIPINNGYMAPIALTLSWMGFSLEECTKLDVKDVNIFEKTICKKRIPDELVPLVTSYINVTYIDDEGPLLKKTWRTIRNKACSKGDISNVIRVIDGISFGNTRTSSLLYSLYQRECEIGKLTKEDFSDIFKLNPDTTSFWTYLKDKQRLYAAYKRVYWET